MSALKDIQERIEASFSVDVSAESGPSLDQKRVVGADVGPAKHSPDTSSEKDNKNNQNGDDGAGDDEKNACRCIHSTEDGFRPLFSSLKETRSGLWSLAHTRLLYAGQHALTIAAYLVCITLHRNLSCHGAVATMPNGETCYMPSQLPLDLVFIVICLKQTWGETIHMASHVSAGILFGGAIALGVQTGLYAIWETQEMVAPTLAEVSVELSNVDESELTAAQVNEVFRLFPLSFGESCV